MTLTAPATKEKIDKLDFMKNLKICVTKVDINRVKRELKEWGKIFANQLSDKGLISRLYRELLKFNNKNTLFTTGQDFPGGAVV